MGLNDLTLHDHRSDLIPVRLSASVPPRLRERILLQFDVHMGLPCQEGRRLVCAFAFKYPVSLPTLPAWRNW